MYIFKFEICFCNLTASVKYFKKKKKSLDRRQIFISAKIIENITRIHLKCSTDEFCVAGLDEEITKTCKNVEGSKPNCKVLIVIIVVSMLFFGRNGRQA